MTSTLPEADTALVRSALRHYSEFFASEAKEDESHVSSPLGAWLLLAQFGSAKMGEGDKEALGAILGLDPREAAEVAKRLLSSPHGAFKAASAVWNKADVTSPGFEAWKAGLAEGTSGPVPTQEEADEWTRKNTLDMIKAFPGQITPLTELILATALAVDITWRDPYDLVSSDELGTGFGSQINLALARKDTNSYLIQTQEAGLVVAHVSYSERDKDFDGVAVVSVIADENVEREAVERAAMRIATHYDFTFPFPFSTAEDDESSPRRISLWDDAAVGAWNEDCAWRLEDSTVWAHRMDPQQDAYAVLPAWKVESEWDLMPSENRDKFGFASGAGILSRILGGDHDASAAQVAVAEYTQHGFKAAAVTSFMFAASAMAPPSMQAPLRTLHARFDRPFASIAVAISRGPWSMLPVFTAWVETPMESVAKEPQKQERGYGRLIGDGLGNGFI